jgi:twitching motility two-component system response regulator PilH
MSAKRILVVDDSIVVTKTTGMVLTKAGYTVSVAADGSAAIGLVRREKPDLIVLDISFPTDVANAGVAWDGLLIMQWLKRLDEGKNIPVIIVSGQDPAKYREAVLKLGAVAFLTKPIDNGELLKLIGETLATNATA